MKDKKIKRYARERFEWWTHWLGLQYSDITLEFVDVIDEGNGLVNLDQVGVCYSNWKYMESHIVLSMRKLRDFDKEQIEKTIVHELMHVMLNEMREDGIEHEERVATSLQKAFFWVRKGIKSGKK
jgi:hypothetical protein